jgi:hypothetical protein
MTTFAATPTDSQTWVITGFDTCDVRGCSQDAAIIADSCNYARFCLNHTDEAAAIVVRYPAFKGWYRITAGRCDHTRQRLTLTVHPL